MFGAFEARPPSIHVQIDFLVECPPFHFQLYSIVPFLDTLVLIMGLK